MIMVFFGRILEEKSKEDVFNSHSNCSHHDGDGFAVVIALLRSNPLYMVILSGKGVSLCSRRISKMCCQLVGLDLWRLYPFDSEINFLAQGDSLP